VRLSGAIERGAAPVRLKIVFRGLSEDARLVDADCFGVGFGEGFGAVALRTDFFFLGGDGALRFPPFPDLRFAMTISWAFEERES
jgi:hypothetical protein